MNIDEQKLRGVNQIQITDALNSALLGLEISRNSYTRPMPDNLTIYVDKQDKNNPTADRKEYIFPLSRQLVFLYESDVALDSDKFIMKLAVENNDVVMKTYVVRNITDYDENGNRHFASMPEIEELESRPIILFEGTNYIYTNYDVDGMDISLTYPKNTEANKLVLNNAIYYFYKQNHPTDFSLEDIYFKDAFTKTGNKLNLNVDNAKVGCITSKNNKFSLDENGNLVVNSIAFNDSSSFLLSVYPVGSIYLSLSSANPATLFGGTWTAINNKFLVASGSSFSPGSSGGSSTHSHTTAGHTLTVSEMPSHTHIQNAHNHTQHPETWMNCAPKDGMIPSSGSFYAQALTATYYTGSTTATNQNTGGNGSHSHGNTGSSSNLPPYLAVYAWQRVA